MRQSCRKQTISSQCLDGFLLECIIVRTRQVDVRRSPHLNWQFQSSIHECIFLTRSVSIRIVCQFQGTIHESLWLQQCSSRRRALTPATYFWTDAWFPTLWSRWCAVENALASILVLLFAGCASYLPHLFQVHFSYPLTLLNYYIPAYLWNRTTTHRKDQYVCDPRMPYYNDVLSNFYVLEHELTPFYQCVKTCLNSNSKAYLITHCVLASALDCVGKGGCHHWPSPHWKKDKIDIPGASTENIWTQMRLCRSLHANACHIWTGFKMCIGLQSLEDSSSFSLGGLFAFERFCCCCCGDVSSGPPWFLLTFIVRTKNLQD